MTTRPARLRLPAMADRSGTIAGIALCTAIAWVANVISAYSAIPAVLVALLCGMAAAHLVDLAPLSRGTGIAARTLLRVGIALIGVRLSAAQIAELGLTTAIVSAGGVILMLTAGTMVARWIGLPGPRSILSAGAVGICGASAALAISTVLPKNPEQERQTVATVALVTALSTLAMILYPVAARLLGFGHLEAGIFFGASIHDVTQVAAAGAIVSPDTATAAVATKLVRVSCLAPAIAAILLFGDARSKRVPGAPRQPFFPMFLLGFALLAIAANSGLMPESLRSGLSATASFLLVVATAALGMKTSLRLLVEDGWRPLAAMFAQTALLALYVIACINIFRL